LSQSAARRQQTRVEIYPGGLGFAMRCGLRQLAVRFSRTLRGFSRNLDPPGLLCQKLGCAHRIPGIKLVCSTPKKEKPWLI